VLFGHEISRVAFTRDEDDVDLLEALGFAYAEFTDVDMA
jgi:hypothetical protein